MCFVYVCRVSPELPQLHASHPVPSERRAANVSELLPGESWINELERATLESEILLFSPFFNTAPWRRISEWINTPWTCAGQADVSLCCLFAHTFDGKHNFYLESINHPWLLAVLCLCMCACVCVHAHACTQACMCVCMWKRWAEGSRVLCSLSVISVSLCSASLVPLTLWGLKSLVSVSAAGMDLQI